MASAVRVRTPGARTWEHRYLHNPVDRNEWSITGSNRTHELRANGVVELPIGPNKLLFREQHGSLCTPDRTLADGLHLQRELGCVADHLGPEQCAGVCAVRERVPDIVGPFPVDKLTGFRWGYRDGNNLNGRYFRPGSVCFRCRSAVCPGDRHCRALVRDAPWTPLR
jgi:hypothetical protein